MEVRTVKLKIPWPFFEVNVFILKEGNEFALIDSGLYSEENFKILEKEVNDFCGGWDKISFIILTHGHPDHYGNLLFIKERAKRQIPVFIHSQDKDRVVELPKEERQRAAEFAKEFLSKNGVPDDKHKIVENQAKSYFSRRYHLEEKEVFPIDLSPDNIYLGSRKLNFIHTPGHTPGHIIVYDEKDGLVFAGDHIFSKGFPVPLLFFSKAEERFKNLPSWLASLKVFENLDVSLVMPGHLESLSDVKTVVQKMFSRVEKMKKKVLEIISGEEITIYELGNKLYPNLPDEFWSFKFSEALGYIDILEMENLVEKVEKNGKIYIRGKLK